MTKVKVVIQSRLSSSRLPAKALLPIGGVPAVVLCASRAANQQADVIVATSTDRSDDLLIAELLKYRIPFLRGPLDDVLARFILATKGMQDTDIVVRLTADNVFPDGAFIKKIVDILKSNQVQYIGTSGTSCELPYGMAIEAFTVGALREADKAAISQYDREHVTPWIIRHYNEYEENWIKNTTNMKDLRCTIDTFEDYVRVAEIFSGVKEPIKESWEGLCDLLFQKRKIASLVKAKDGKSYSRITLGTAQMGMEYGAANVTGKPSLEKTIKIIKTALDAGVNVIDCARAYGDAEYRVGQATKEENKNNITIITKLDPLDILEKNVEEKYIKYLVDASIYRSCFELGVEKLDVVLLHRWKHRYLYNEAVWKRLIELQQSGVIGELGVSVNDPNELIEALQETRIKNIQLPFNILDWRWKEAGIDNLLAKRSDLNIFARSVFLQGILTASSEFWPTNKEINSEYWIEKIENCVKQLKRINKKDLCISYVRSQPWITSLVIGVDNVEQLEENVNYFNRPILTCEEVSFIEQEFKRVPEVVLAPSKWKM